LVARSHGSAGTLIVMGAGRTNDIPNDLVTLTGVSLGDSDLGTFTGTTIADNETIKGALQDLETAVEAGGGVKYHGRYDTEAETARSGATHDDGDLLHGAAGRRRLRGERGRRRRPWRGRVKPTKALLLGQVRRGP
jgi:hypothetical protein